VVAEVAGRYSKCSRHMRSSSEPQNPKVQAAWQKPSGMAGSGRHAGSVPGMQGRRAVTQQQVRQAGSRGAAQAAVRVKAGLSRQVGSKGVVGWQVAGGVNRVQLGSGVRQVVVANHVQTGGNKA